LSAASAATNIESWPTGLQYEACTHDRDVANRE